MEILNFVKSMLNKMNIPLQQRKFGFTLDIESEIIIQLSKLLEKEIDSIILEAYSLTKEVIGNVK